MMHKSPLAQQAVPMANPAPPVVETKTPYSAKVLVAAMGWLWLVAVCMGPAWAASPPPQEKQPEAATAAQPAGEPAPPAPPAIDLSDEVVRDVLTNLQRGIEGHDIDRVMEIFDRQNMKDYAQFHDQMVAFFRRYDSVNFRYQLLQVTSDKDASFAIVDLDMDADPSDLLPTQP